MFFLKIVYFIAFTSSFWISQAMATSKHICSPKQEIIGVQGANLSFNLWPIHSIHYPKLILSNYGVEGIGVRYRGQQDDLEQIIDLKKQENILILGESSYYFSVINFIEKVVLTLIDKESEEKIVIKQRVITYECVITEEKK